MLCIFCFVWLCDIICSVLCIFLLDPQVGHTKKMTGLHLECICNLGFSRVHRLGHKIIFKQET